MLYQWAPASDTSNPMTMDKLLVSTFCLKKRWWGLERLAWWLTAYFVLAVTQRLAPSTHFSQLGSQLPGTPVPFPLLASIDTAHMHKPAIIHT